jgi:hypothetical protein
MVKNGPYNGIALAGKAGSGKDYFAYRISQVMEICDLSPALMSFADPLKMETELFSGLSPGHPKFREQALIVGDDARASDPLVYVKQMRDRLVRTIASGHIPIITDLRLQNERELCQSQGLLLVRVDAPYVERLQALQIRGEDEALLDSIHPTEIELDEAEFDVTVVNLWSSFETLKTVAQIVALWSGEMETVR